MKLRNKAALAAGGLGLAVAAIAAPAASAGVSPVAQYTNASVNPVSGYYANNLGTYFTHAYSYIGSNGSASLLNLQAGAQNGAGIGLCDANPGIPAAFGDALQVGDVLNSDNTIAVTYGGGRFNPAWAGVTNGNPCQNGSTGDPRVGGGTNDVLTAATAPVAFAGLGHIVASDTVVVQILESPVHHFSGCNPGQVLFEAQDLTTGSGWVSSPCLTYAALSLAGNPQFTEAEAGVVADTAGLIAPADRLLAVFAHVGLTGAKGHHGSFQADPAWTVHPVASTHNASPSGLVYLAPVPFPNAFSNDHFNEDSGTPIG